MKNSKLLRIVTAVICVVALCCISFILGGATQDLDEKNPVRTEKEIDLEMNASLLSVDGQIQKTFALTVDGPIVKEGNMTQLNFLIHMPDEATPEIGWKYEPLDEGYKRPIPWELEYEDYVWFDYCFNYVSNKYEHVLFGLSIEREYLIAYWNDGEDHLLMASTDPDTTVDEIKEHFSYFIGKYATPFANQQE